MTEKYNYLKVLNGEKAEWVPNFSEAAALFAPLAVFDTEIPGSGNPDKKIVDITGKEWNNRGCYINYLGIESTMTIDGSMPTPGKHILTDITKWKEQVSYPFPDLEKVEFSKIAAGYFSMVDRNEKAIVYMMESVFFALINSMGVADALCALVEEPEAVKEFFEELTDYADKCLRLTYPYFKPEVIVIADDVATSLDLFMAPRIYEELIAPYHRRLANTVIELGASPEMHCCGKCEKLIPLWIDMGFKSWQPAQPVNDLVGIKEQYGTKMILNGGWNTAGKGGLPGASEEAVRESVRETIDLLAPGYGFVFWDGGLTGGDVEKFSWTADEANKYRKTFYQKNN
ncbi:uroporphyrinogen decarboxylase family protein [Acetobacterium woodii]|nr:uroporphyrinogen decarboxylase family protein [Acetobacterium woodii]